MPRWPIRLSRSSSCCRPRREGAIGDRRVAAAGQELAVSSDDKSAGLRLELDPSPVVDSLSAMLPALIETLSEATAIDDPEVLEWLALDLILDDPSITEQSDGVVATDACAFYNVAVDHGEAAGYDGRFAVARSTRGLRFPPIYYNVRTGRGYRGVAPTRHTKPDAWPIPRLVTERSFEAQRRPGDNPRLGRPGVSSEFKKAYMLLF